MNRRKFLRITGPSVFLGTLVGCTGEPTDSGSGSRTTLPDETVSFPDGPKEPPNRPNPLTEDTARDYVREYERRYVYNQLWKSEDSLVGVTCEVESVENIKVGFKVAVSCEGEAKSGGSGEDDPPVYSDYFETTSIYYVDDTSVIRETTSETATTTSQP